MKVNNRGKRLAAGGYRVNSYQATQFRIWAYLKKSETV